MAGLTGQGLTTPAFAPPVSEDYDCETGALVRACLRPLFDTASGWKDLAERLGRRGFTLAIRDGRLVVLDIASGRKICSARYLGTTLRELSGRMGRPMVRASRDSSATGELQV